MIKLISDTTTRLVYGGSLSAGHAIYSSQMPTAESCFLTQTCSKAEHATYEASFTGLQ